MNSSLAPQTILLCYPGFEKGANQPLNADFDHLPHNQFKEDLKTLLAQYLSPSPAIVVTSYLEVVSGLKSTPVADTSKFFLLILTGSSTSNTQCLSDLRQFAAEIDSKIPKSLVFTVIQETLNPRLLPAEILSLENYILAEADEKGYWQCVDDIANDIARTLNQKNIQGDERAKKHIVLAPVIPDLEPEARNIRRDLEHRGAVVLRAIQQNHNFNAEFNRQLENSVASIHLLEKASFDASHDSGSGDIDALGMALEYAKHNPEFQILTWTPLQDHEDHTEQLILQLIRKHQELSSNTEVVQNSLEDFKSLIIERLGNASRLRHHSIERGKHKEVYVIYDKQDEEATKAVTEYLGTFGIEVLQTSFSGGQSEIRQMHNEFLRRCDAALVIYGRVREPWVRMKQQDLLRSAALGRSKAILAKAVYLCPEITEDKRRFSAQDMIIINGEAPAMGLDPFLQSLMV